MSSLSRPFTDFQITVVSDGPFFVDRLFRAKFNSPAPDYGHALIAFYRRAWNHFVPVGYVNFLPYEEVILVGGGMTDGAALRQVPEQTRQAITESGGVLYALLTYGFDRFAFECEAFFGYTADPRALEVDLAAGFAHTQHERLIVNFHKPLSEERKQALIEKIHSIGAF